MIVKEYGSMPDKNGSGESLRIRDGKKGHVLKKRVPISGFLDQLVTTSGACVMSLCRSIHVTAERSMLKVGPHDRWVVLFEVRFGFLEDVLWQGVSTGGRCSHGTGGVR